MKAGDSMMLKLAVVITTIFLWLVSSPAAWAWDWEHEAMRRWAVDRLPEWQQRRFRAELELLVAQYTRLQDAYAGGRRPDLAAYCRPPGPGVSLHDVGAPGVAVPAMAWMLHNIIEDVHARRADEAMKRLGVLCHWNEDPGSPSAHCSPVNEWTLRLLIPPPANKRHYNYLFGYGGLSNLSRFTLPKEDYRPRLLGASVYEAAARIYQHQRRLRRAAQGKLVTVIGDQVYGDGKRANAARRELATGVGRHVADIIYTALCLATDRVDPDESDALQVQRLSEWLPSYDGKAGLLPHPYYAVPYLVDAAIDLDRKLHPLQFSGDDTQVSSGFGMGTPFALPYHIAPGGVWDRFTCRVGLHPTAGPRGAVMFAVRVNGAQAARSPVMRSGAPPVAITAKLPDSAEVRLELVTIPAEGSEPTHNLTVWGDPELHRAKVPLAYSPPSKGRH